MNPLSHQITHDLSPVIWILLVVLLVLAVLYLIRRV